MNSYLSEFIKNNTDIINNDEMDLVYSKCLMNERGKLTSLLIDAGIPVMNLFKDTIPESFLEGAELDSIKLPSNIKTIDTRGFFESKLKHIELNNNLEKGHLNQSKFLTLLQHLKIVFFLNALRYKVLNYHLT